MLYFIIYHNIRGSVILITHAVRDCNVEKLKALMSMSPNMNMTRGGESGAITLRIEAKKCQTPKMKLLVSAISEAHQSGDTSDAGDAIKYKCPTHCYIRDNKTNPQLACFNGPKKK